MTYLSRTARLGIAAEQIPATWAAPSFTIPFEQGTRFRDHIIQLHDMTIRASDVVDAQDLQQGPYWTDWTITTLGYGDWVGWLFRAMIGPDQVTPGILTTFAAAASPGAASISLTAAPPANAVLQLGAGSTLEYVQAGTPTGTGPYTVPVSTPGGLRYAHASGEAAASQAAHLFQQHRPIGQAWPSYSLTMDDGTETLGWPGCILGSIGIKVTAEDRVFFTATWSGYPPVSEAVFAEAESGVQPPSGWAWTVTTAGGVSTRGLTLDLALSRDLDVHPCANGYQAPLVIATGPMRTTAAYKAIFDTPADLNQYRQALQQPAVWTFGQPAASGGATIQVTLAKSGWTDGEAGLQDPSGYVTGAFKLSGIANTTDSPASGVAQVTLMNFVQAAYGPTPFQMFSARPGLIWPGASWPGSP